MKLRNSWTLALPLLTLLLGATACSVQKANSALPPQAAAPTLPPAAKPAESSQGPRPRSQSAETEVRTLAPTAAAAPAPARTVPPPAPMDPVADLIQRVEKLYQQGQDNYKTGNVEAAKQTFDQAFNLLASTNLHSDERLQREFDRLLEGVNALDTALLPETDTASEQKSEPAPIDEANEVTFPVDANIKAKAEAEIKSTASDLPLMMTDQVASYINYFSSRGRPTLTNALARSGRYEDMIRRVLGEEGVPRDLIYLAQAESGFHPLALSRAGARGMWQFMGSRARGYGLERNFWIDERQDPERATRAAARHLKDLYKQFGDWYLAMAAYNSGPGTVQSAVRRTGYADFWELYRRNVLPHETRNYVPIIVAVTIMAKNPGQYGLDDVVREKPVPHDSITINYSVDLRLVADCVDAPLTDIQDLNPSLLRSVTPKDTQFALHLPIGTKDKFATAVSAIPTDMRAWWRYHKVEPDDTLASLARSYHSNAKAIFTANELVTEELTAGSKLIIPITPGKHPAGEDGMTYARRITRYKIRKGDTVTSVSENLGIPARMIRNWNRLKGDSLNGRRTLYVHLPISPAAARETQLLRSKSRTTKKKNAAVETVSGNGAVRHKVQQGETLYSIATSYNTTVSALKRANSNIATLRPGMILIIRP